MKNALLVVVMALVLGMSGVAFAAETAVETEAPQPVATETQETLTADQWLEAQAEVLPDALFAGEFCGGVFCGKFTYCCNPTCALCVPYGMSCTMEACN
jgi:predicted lysophospholipase L1 biosynthesis ABC-type transport system permease subunit